MPDYPRPATPPYGWPVHEAIESVREDLRQHVEATNASFAEVRGDLKGVNQHVADARLEVAQVTAVCERIEDSLRASEVTKVDKRRYKGRLRLKLWGTLLGVLLVAGTEGVHWLVRHFS